MGIKHSKIVEKPKHEMSLNPLQTSAEYVNSSPQRRRIGSRVVALHKAALKGDWNSAIELISENRELMTSPISSEGGEIALHIAAVEGHEIFVSNLMGMMEEGEWGIVNKKGCTALCFAAAAGQAPITQLMLNRCPHLATIKGDNGVRPLYMAALQGHQEITKILYKDSAFDSWTFQDQIDLLTAAIDSGLYGLAKRIVNQHQTLAVAEDSNGETPLQVLARNPLAFCCINNNQGLWVTNIITTAVTSRNMSAESDACILLDCLREAAAACEEDIEAGRRGNALQLFCIAAESGNEDFLVELLKRDLELLYKVNASQQSVFHIAVLHRYVKLFNLTNELSGIKVISVTYIDSDGNNILHLAAKLPPACQLNAIPGAALQMQREVLWYKEVEKLVPPSYRRMRNNAGQTPSELFLAEHEPLMKQGEKLMKQTAKACMLVTMLIATVVFTTAFTVPGGYDNTTGAPILENKRLFALFPASEAVATLCSLTSMLMFLSMLTSRYSGEDFLRTLPLWLAVGVAALFFSIVAMMVAFCTCLLFFEHGKHAVTLVVVFFGSVPAMFVVLNYGMLRTVLRCTYNCNWLFRSHHRLHS